MATLMHVRVCDVTLFLEVLNFVLQFELYSKARGQQNCNVSFISEDSFYLLQPVAINKNI